MFLGDWNVFEAEWLWISIVLFLVTVVDAQLLTLPTVRRLVELTTPTDAEPHEASPEVAALFRKVRRGGSLSAAILIIITLLMIWKPGT